MRVRASLLAGICASAISFPAFAQDATGDDLEDPRFSTNVIIVTAPVSYTHLTLPTKA